MKHKKLRQLRDILREKSTWPPMFRWSYAHAGHGPGGLGRQAGILKPGSKSYHEQLGMDWDSYKHIFVYANYPTSNKPQRMMGAVEMTPEYIADLIDHWLNIQPKEDA